MPRGATASLWLGARQCAPRDQRFSAPGDSLDPAPLAGLEGPAIEIAARKPDFVTATLRTASCLIRRTLVTRGEAAASANRQSFGTWNGARPPRSWLRKLRFGPGDLSRTSVPVTQKTVGLLSRRVFLIW